MKKLVMILSAAFLFGLFADQLPTGVNFEAFNAGQFDFSKQDNGEDQKQAGDKAYWIYGADAEGRIIEESDRYAQSDAPEMWKDTPNEKFLHFSSGNAYRTARSCITKNNTRYEIRDQPIVDFEKSDVYFDTMLKFVPYEELPTEMPDARAKLSVFAYAPENGGYTNLVISGGYIFGGYRLFTNYVSEVAIDLEKWYHLTIRAINAGKDREQSAFLVYLDEQLISRREGDDCGLKVKDLSAIGEKYLDSIIPSFSYAYTQACAMGFSGTGDIDDLSITATKPDFIQEELYYTINWSEGVTSIQIDDGEAFAVECEGYTNIVLEAGVTSVTITATYAKGYERGTWRQGWTLVEGNEFKDLVRAQLYIDAMIPLYDIGGKHYGSSGDMLCAAKNGDAIKLLADVVDNLMFSDDVTDITIDLAGHTITSYFSDAPVICGSGEASITIINSTSKIGKVIPIYGTSPWEEVFAVISCEVAIYGGVFCGFVESDIDTVNVVAGQFHDPGAQGDVDCFYLVCDGSVDVADVTYIGNGYFQVGETPVKTYPTYITDHASDELKDKFDKWVTDVNGGDRDVGSEELEAYFLNCRPDQVEAKKEEFRITLITKDADGNWVVKVGDKGQDAEYGNGYINIISVKEDKFPTAGDDADFFQATLVIEPVDKE